MPLFGISIQFLQSNIFSRSRGFTEFPMSCHFSAQKDSPGAGLSQNSVSWSRHKASLLTAWRLLFSRGPGPVTVGGAMALRSLRRLALAQARWRGQGVSFHPARRRFFDEVWGLSFLGLSHKIQEDEGSLFLDNFKSNRCLSPLCAVFREGGLTQTTMEQHFFHCRASTINDHRDIFKYCSLRFDAPPSSCTRAMPCHAQAVCAVSASLPGATAAMSSAGPAPFCRAGAGRCRGTAWRTAWNAHCFILPAFQWVNRWLFVVLVVAGWAACWLLFLTRRFCLRRVRPRQAQHARARPSCCASCKEDGMVDIRNRKCRCGAARSHFGMPADARATCCAKCKEDGMVNIMTPKCRCGRAIPSFGMPGDAVCCCSLGLTS